MPTAEETRTSSRKAHGGIVADDDPRLALAASALQSVPDASTSVKGVAKKSAALDSAVITPIVNNTGGSVIGTIPLLVGALYSADAVAIQNALTTAFAQINLTSVRLEELIAKQQTAGQQT